LNSARRNRRCTRMARRPRTPLANQLLRAAQIPGSGLSSGSSRRSPKESVIALVRAAIPRLGVLSRMGRADQFNVTRRAKGWSGRGRGRWPNPSQGTEAKTRVVLLGRSRSRPGHRFHVRRRGVPVPHASSELCCRWRASSWALAGWPPPSAGLPRIRDCRFSAGQAKPVRLQGAAQGLHRSRSSSWQSAHDLMPDAGA